jgi:hypothetical protein
MPKRFYGTTKLDALSLRRDVGQIADEVLQHFSSLVGAEVEITLELHLNLPDGIPENVIRTITENCRVLKFTNQEFCDFTYNFAAVGSISLPFHEAKPSF